MKKIEGLASWFKQYQAKRIKVFYEQIRLRHMQGLNDTITMIKDEALVFDRLYHRYLSTYLTLKYRDVLTIEKDLRLEREIRCALSDEEFTIRIRDAYLLRKAVLIDRDKSYMGRRLKELALSGITNQEYKEFFELKELRQAIEKGTMAFDFNLVDEHGEYHKLSDYKGKVVLLSFWYSSCPSCIAEFEAERALEALFSKKEFVLISICTRTQIDTWKNFLKGNQVNSVSLFVQEDHEKRIEEEYQISSYPNFVLIDKEGLVWRDKCRRPRDERLIADINELLNEKK